MSAPAVAILDPSRALDPAGYRLGDRAPRMALRPANAEEAAEALRAASHERWAVMPWGGGTRIARDRAPERYDLALDLQGLNRIVEYDPEDFTVTAEAGVTIAALRQALAAHHQGLPLESSNAARATLGGTFATNASGPRRLRFGSPRDRILGARFALADGTLAKSGGKVVKNVAGFAVHRLLCGSRGALAVILEASLKLAPGCERRAVLLYAADAQSIAEAARWSFLPRLEPAFVSVLGAGAARALPRAADAPFTVAIGIEEDAAWAAEQRRAIEAALGTPAALIEDDPTADFIQALTDAENHVAPRLTLTSAHNTIGALAPLVARSEASRLVCHAAAGRLHWYPEAGDSTATVRDLAAFGYTPIETAGAVTAEPPLPPESATISLRARIKTALDPAGNLIGTM